MVQFGRSLSPEGRFRPPERRARPLPFFRGGRKRLAGGQTQDRVSTCGGTDCLQLDRGGWRRASRSGCGLQSALTPLYVLVLSSDSSRAVRATCILVGYCARTLPILGRPPFGGGRAPHRAGCAAGHKSRTPPETRRCRPSRTPAAAAPGTPQWRAPARGACHQVRGPRAAS